MGIDGFVQNLNLRKPLRKFSEKINFKDWRWEIESSLNFDFKNFLQYKNEAYIHNFYDYNLQKETVTKSTLLIAEKAKALATIKTLFIQKTLEKTFKLVWSEVENAKKYNVQIWSFNEVSNNLENQILTDNTTTQFAIETLKPNTKYQIRILAMHTDNPGTTLETQDQMRFSQSTSEPFTLESLTELHHNIMCQDPC